jgi:AbrB family looped-hinge helix DNA binding protein
MAAQIAVSKLTVKHQATIPAAVRRKLGLRAGSRVGFVIQGDQVVLRRADPMGADFLTRSIHADMAGAELAAFGRA